MGKWKGWQSGDAKCRRCGGTRSAHEDGRCPTGKSVWYGSDGCARASFSIGAEEAQIFKALVLGAAAKKDMSLLARRPAFARLARKAMRAAESTQEIAADIAAEERRPTISDAVRAYVFGRSDGFSMVQLSRDLGLKLDSVRKVIYLMRDRGHVDHVRHGEWKFSGRRG